MGLRFRKNINLGGGFRINLSKSGVGYSWGVPGYRATKLANGSTRETLSLPGTGISYVTSQGKQKKSNNDNDNNISNVEDIVNFEETKTYENTNIDDLGNGDEVLKLIKRTRKIDLTANILLLMIIFCSVPFFIVPVIIGAILKILLATKWKIDLTYDFDEYSRKRYESFNKALNELSKSHRIWQIHTSTHVSDIKYHGGASNSITRNAASINTKLPYYIKHNVEVYVLKLKKEKMIFTPDRVIFFKGSSKVYGSSYKDMKIELSDTRFVESESVPSDAQIVDYTWQYVNKNGGPDMRFNNNKKFPICRYGEIKFETEDGINIYIEYSNVSLMNEISKYLLESNKKYNDEEVKKEKEQPTSKNEDAKHNDEIDNNEKSVYDKLSEYKKLLDDGTLTNKEYENIKSKLLDK